MSQTLQSFFDTIYRPLRLTQASAGCLKQYRLNIAKVNAALDRAALLSDLSDDLLARVCGSMIADGRSPATANKVRAQLVALWTFAAKRGLVATYPTIGKYREFKREPIAWTKDQLRTLFTACSRQSGMIGEVPASLWWLALLSLLWDTGLRIGAVLKMQWHQVDFERGFVLVLAEQQKDHEDQWFRLHAHTLMLLRRMRRKEGCVFHWPKSHGRLYLAYGAILRQAGLPSTRRDKFHKIRRSVASWFEAAGGNATELLGHSCRQVTRVYLDGTITGRTHAADLLFRPDGAA